jgi:hypothetical protein
MLHQKGGHDIQHSDTQRNYIQQNNELNVTYFIMALSKMAEELLCSVSLIMSVTYKPFILSVGALQKGLHSGRLQLWQFTCDKMV